MASSNKDKDVISASELGIDPEELWQAADKLRGSIDAAEYKHVVLGLIFLKYISDAFEARRTKLTEELKADGIEGEQVKKLLESRDEYTAENVFWVPPEARWSNIQNQAKQPNNAKLIDDAMYSIERDNPKLKGKLPRDYARRGIPPERLGGLIDQIASIAIGTDEARAKDILGRVYEYFLGKFAAAEGKLGGEFFTPGCVVRLLVEMIEPYKGRVYDPCCGSGGMFVQSIRFVESHATQNGNGKGKSQKKTNAQRNVSIFGQESNPTTWRLAHMNLAIRGIEANLGDQPADSFMRDLHPDLKADYILANPPFNISEWSGELLRDDVRWKFGSPPVSNANYAWIQHFIHHLAPTGVAGFVMVNGSMNSLQSSDFSIRKSLVEAYLIVCMVALPSHLFYSMYSQVCLWFIARNKAAPGYRDRRGETLFIDARDLGQMIERTHRELTDDDIVTIVSSYHAWQHDGDSREYRDVPGFCKSARINDIRHKGFALAPSRYVGSEIEDVSDGPTSERLQLISGALIQELKESCQRNETIISNLSTLGIFSKEEPRDDYRELSFSSRSDLVASVESHLDSLSRSLFKSWFVDFDPVLAKAERADTGLSPEVDALFPSGVEQSELGDIPAGWVVGRYADVVTPHSERIGDTEAKVFSATVTGLAPRSDRFNKSLSKSSAKNKRIRRHNLVFGLSRRTLNFGVMTEEEGSVSPVYEVFIIDETKYVPLLLELYIRYYMKAHIDILKPGAREGQPIDRDYLLSKELLIPDIRIQRVFHALVNGYQIPPYLTQGA